MKIPSKALLILTLCLLVATGCLNQRLGTVAPNTRTTKLETPPTSQIATAAVRKPSATALNNLESPTFAGAKPTLPITRVGSPKTEESVGTRAKPTTTIIVPVMPNESIIRGEVKSQTIVSASSLGIEPEMPLSVFRLLLISSQAAPGMRDFIQAEVGNEIEAISKESTELDLIGQTIQAHLRVALIPTGKQIWLTQIEIIP